MSRGKSPRPTSSRSAARSEIRSLPGPRARALLERDARRISPSYPRDYPFVMDHGLGTEVWDVDGNRFLDFAAGIAVCSTGHSHPRVVRAVQDQAAKFLHISSDFYHSSMIDLADRLDGIVPIEEETAVFLGNSGTEAVEAALKLARHHTGRPHFIGFLGGFHGRTMGSLAFTSSKAKQRAGFFPMMPGVTHVPYPDPRRPILDARGGDAGETVVDYIENVLFAQLVPPGEVAAVLVEPIQGEGGYIVPAAGFLPALRRLCDRHGILLVADEVQSGMGRTGRWFAIEHQGVEPDIVCVAKGIASGVPLGAMVARRRVATWTAGAHGNTYGGNPLACAAALATIDVIEEERLLDNAAARGASAMTRLRAMAERHPSIGDVRGIGLMIGVEFVRDRASGEPDPARADAVVHGAFERGLLLLGCGRSTVRIAPPLNLTAEHLEEGLDLFESAVAAAEARD